MPDKRSVRSKERERERERHYFVSVSTSICICSCISVCICICCSACFFMYSFLIIGAAHATDIQTNIYKYICIYILIVFDIQDVDLLLDSSQNKTNKAHISSTMRNFLLLFRLAGNEWINRFLHGLQMLLFLLFSLLFFLHTAN